MGFFGDSSSSATDNRQATTDQSTLFGRNVGQYVGAGAVGMGANGTLLGSGASQTNLKITNTGKGTVTLQNMDAEVAQNAMDKISGLAGDFGKSLSDFMTGANQNALQLAAINSASMQTTQDSLLSNQNQQEADQQKNFTGILDKFAGLLANQQPAGTVDYNKTMLYIVLGVLALVGAIFYFRK